MGVWFIDRHSAYKTVDSSGSSGTYGEVRRCQLKRDTQPAPKHYALKKIKMARESEGFPITALREIQVLQSLNHTNVIRLHEICVVAKEVVNLESDQYCFMVRPNPPKIPHHA